MTHSDHQLISELFLAACDLSLAERTAFLERECAGNPELRTRVEALLKQDERGSALLDHNAGVANLAQIDGITAPALPERIGAYRILGLLGVGGMGVVYRAEQEQPRRHVALKILNGVFATQALCKRFELEAALLGRLKHPGIAQIYEAGSAGTTPPRPFLVMELIDGTSLLEHAAHAKLALRARLALFIKICEAVHHAHQKGVIHRDLKPSNIMVEASGQPKILDFGVAKSTDCDLNQVTQHTTAGEIIGTIAYMSPEQAAGDADLDIRSDVYSLGVILCELLSGRLPYPSMPRRLSDAVRVIRDGEVLPLSALDPRLRGDVETIAAKALAKERERRYASAAELAADVGRYLAHLPVQAKPATRRYLLRKFIHRNRALVSTLGAIALSLVIGLITTTYYYVDARRNSAAMARERDRALSLADVRRYDELVREADTLWPARPAMVGRMQAWVDRAADLLSRREQHHSYIRQLAAQVSESYETSWLRDNLVQLVSKLDQLANPQTGLLREVRQRLEIATTITAKTIEEHQRDWDAAINEIADSQHYGGLLIVEQLGLVPLAPDPRSGLWEFWAWETGAAPQRGDNGQWVIGEQTGMVLVLLPGGSYAMGASPDPTAANHDPLAYPDEAPVELVALDPFFIAKHEMTQGQWLHIMHANPSGVAPESPRLSPGMVVSLAHPVEQVSRLECETALGRVALELPTEAQWEYAARAGSQTPWWTGDKPESVQGAANVADRSYSLLRPILDTASFDDGHIHHAPVGSFRANQFGLHDVIGNVWEWVADGRPKYDVPCEPGDGRRSQSGKAFMRGGSQSMPLVMCRSSSRTEAGLDYRQLDAGLRAARALDR